MPPPWQSDIKPQNRFDRYLVTLDRHQQEVTKKGIAWLTVDELRFYREQYETLLKELNQNMVRSGRFHLYYQTLKKIQQKLRLSEVSLQTDGALFLERHQANMPKGINDVSYEKDSKHNCAIVSLAALLGKRVSELSGQDIYTRRPFCPPEFGLEATYQDQASGMFRYLKRIEHPVSIDDSHIKGSNLVSYKKAEAAMLKKYPAGTQFLVYSTHHLAEHWTYAEHWPDGVRFYDYQIDVPQGQTFEYDSSESHKGSESDPEPPSDHSQAGSKNSDISPWGTSEPDEPHFVPSELAVSAISILATTRQAAAPDKTASINTLHSIANEYKDRDPNTIRKDFPYPVEYRDGHRYILSPLEVGFIACRPMIKE